MHPVSLLLAALPALALAQEAPPASDAVSSTVTQTSVTTMTKTIVVSRLATVTSSANGTSDGSIGTTSLPVYPTGAASPTTVVTSSTPGGPTVNAAGSLDATRVALAGIAGMVAAAML